MTDRHVSRRRVLAGAAGALATAAVVGTASAERDARPVGAWPMAGFDAANTGNAAAASGFDEAPEPAWRTSVAGQGWSAPVVADGRVHALHRPSQGDGETRLFAFDAVTGERRWVSTLGVRSETPAPAVVDGTVFVGLQYDQDGDRTGGVGAFDAATGEREWQHGTRDGVAAPLAVADGTVYAASATALLAVDATTGGVDWRVPTTPEPQQFSLARPAVADGVVYLPTPAETVLAVDAADGSRRWEHDVPGPAYRGCAVSQGRVYAATTDTAGPGGGAVLALEAGSGERAWTVESRTEPFASLSLGRGRLYGGTRRTAFALDAADGTVAWTVDATAPRATLRTPDAVLVRDSGGLGALSPADGTVRWTLDLASPGAQPAIAGGRLFVPTEGPAFRAFATDAARTATATATRTTTATDTATTTATRTSTRTTSSQRATTATGTTDGSGSGGGGGTTATGTGTTATGTGKTTESGARDTSTRTAIIRDDTTEALVDQTPGFGVGTAVAAVGASAALALRRLRGDAD